MVGHDFCYYLFKGLIPIFVEDRSTFFIKNRFTLWNFLSIGCGLLRKKNFHNSFSLTITTIDKLVFVLTKLISFAGKETFIISLICKFEFGECLDLWLLCPIKYSLVLATKTVVLGGRVIIGHLVCTLVIPLGIVDDQVSAGVRNLHVRVKYRVV
jgi:hypothetical protein